MMWKIAFLLLFTSGCSNWELKERCEKTNWFEYAQSVSYQGRYLEEDPFVKDCKGFDLVNSVQLDQGFKLGREKMCSYDEIYHRGTEGEPVFFKFCDGLEKHKMQKRHLEGLSLFCTSLIGYQYGGSGKIYKNVCSVEQEKFFLPSYYQGRKEFLIRKIEEDKRSLDWAQSQLEITLKRELSISAEYRSIPHLLSCQQKSVYNEVAKKNESVQVCEEPYYIKSQRESIYSQLSQARDSVRHLQNQVRLLNADLAADQLALVQIPLQGPLAMPPSEEKK